MSPPSDTYPGNQKVTITDSTPGATIQYTIDGSKLTSSSPVYTAPIPVTGDGPHETIIAGMQLIKVSNLYLYVASTSDSTGFSFGSNGLFFFLGAGVEHTPRGSCPH